MSVILLDMVWVMNHATAAHFMPPDKTTEIGNTKRDFADPFDYMAKARKPSKIAQKQQKRQNVSNCKPEKGK